MLSVTQDMRPASRQYKAKILLLMGYAEQRTAIVELYLFVAIIRNGAIHTLLEA
jgi:hypothetical protein